MTWSSRRTLAIAAGLLVLHVLLATFGLSRVGFTNDETAHLTAGYTYWKFNDYRLQPENGNLPQRWGALPLLALQPDLTPADHPEWWQQTELWLLSDHFLFGSGNDPDLLLRWARRAMVVWSAALGLLVFIWSRRLWGDAGALVSLSLYAFSPTLLAHAPLVTSDVTGACCLLAAVGAFWRALRQGGKWLAVSGMVTGLAFVAKFSCVMLLPAFALLGAWHVALPPGDKPSRAAAGRTFALLLLLNGVAAVASIWLFFGLRYGASGPAMPPIEKFMLPWEETLSLPGMVTAVIQFARDLKLLPEAYIEGFAFVRYFGTARGAFLDGAYSTTGWWWFFPAAFYWKSTVVELLCTGALGALFVAKIRRPWPHQLRSLTRLAPLLVWAVVFGTFCLTSNLNIGQRHILPLYPVLFILAGALFATVPSRFRKGMILLPLTSAIIALNIAPHYLTFFNALSGGPKQGWKKLADSSLDWGQGLPELSRWVQENRQPDETLYVSYFGSDALARRLPDAIPFAPIYDHFRLRRFEELEPGLYCIGATMLQDVFSPVNGPWDAAKEEAYRAGMAWARQQLETGQLENRIIDFGRAGTAGLWQVERLRFARLMLYLRERRPDAIVANTTLVFRLNELELRAMIDGPPTVVERMIEAAKRGEIPGRDS